MENLDLLNNLLSDIGNFVLVIFGFSVTLFTVLYSFILNKREQLIEYSDKIKEGILDIVVIQRERNALHFIKNFKNFNRHLSITIFIDLTVYLLCMFSKYLLESESIKQAFTFVLGIITSIIVIYVAIMLVMTIHDYNKITKLC